MHWPLGEAERIVGRAPGCDIVIDEPSVSARHFAVRRAGRGVVVRDLGSTNGSWVDGERAAQFRVERDGRFVAGRVLLAVREGISLESGPSDGVAGAVRTAVSLTGTGDPRGTTPVVPGPTGVEELAAIFAARAPCEQVRERLLAWLCHLGSAAGATVAARSNGHWSVQETWGVALPRVDDDVLKRGEDVLCRAGPADGPATLVLAVGDVRVLAGPWSGPAPDDGRLRLAGAMIARLSAAPDVPAARASDPDADAAASGDPVFLTVSDSCRSALRELDRLARTTLPVLLVGESGTGKELLARRLHARSPRGSGPFVALNCAALPTELLESELFGIERAVATGVAARAGRFVLASGGTLFLDEIGDLPESLQPKLLRALESGEVTPLGASAPVRVDVRLVAATHRDLHAQAAAGAGFRRDLLFRVAGAVLAIPALRERPEDVLPLARWFAREAARASGQHFAGLDLEAARLLAGYPWPGNVRELRHVMLRAIALADGPVLTPDLLPPEIHGHGDRERGDLMLAGHEEWRVARERFERFYFARLVERCANLTEAARVAGLARSHLYRKLEELGLRGSQD